MKLTRQRFLRQSLFSGETGMEEASSFAMKPSQQEGASYKRKARLSFLVVLHFSII